MTTCAHHQLGHKNVNFLCIHVKGLATLKFVLLNLALVVFIITDNQDFIPEACVSHESHYNKCFLFTSICLSPSLFHLISCVIFIPPSFLHLPFLFLSTLLFFITSIYVCI